jgi:hypothetical protein
MLSALLQEMTASPPHNPRPPGGQEQLAVHKEFRVIINSIDHEQSVHKKGTPKKS